MAVSALPEYRSRGRPKVDRELRDLIRRMCEENPLWGAPRIHGELLKLGFIVAQSTVSKYMLRGRRPPSQGWKTFLRNHADGIAAVDFLVVPTLTFERLFAFFYSASVAETSCRSVSRPTPQRNGWPDRSPMPFHGTAPRPFSSAIMTVHMARFSSGGFAQWASVIDLLLLDHPGRTVTLSG